MGWWKVRSVESGGIDWNFDSGTKLVNALPGESHTEMHYSGDGPADIVGATVETLETFFESIDHQPKRSDFTWLFLEFAPSLFTKDLDEVLSDQLTFPAWCDHDEGDPVYYLGDMLKETFDELAEEYKRAWGRPPYPEEIEATLNFVIGYKYPEK